MKHPFALLCCLLVFSLGASAGLILHSNSTVGNFDASSGTRDVAVTGLEAGYGTGTISDVVVAINFAKADGSNFDPPYPGGTPFYDEIRFMLTGPGAQNVTLIAADSWSSGSGQFDGIIYFDQSAGQVVNYTTGPVAGTFRPTGAGSLDDYLGTSALGTWTLTIQDTVGSDSLRFRNFDLYIGTDGSQWQGGGGEIPEPGTYLLVGAGLLLIPLFRRR
ncbi:MAG: hypothetical protein HY821_11690 [Acidobacteria bacterium]|nr:hypothetical protein [Acidobacteriota bacterium]